MISVAASVSRQTWKANYADEVSARQNLVNFASGGPREDGGSRTAAPGSAIRRAHVAPGSPVPGVGYDLPAGYAMFNGTTSGLPGGGR